MSAPSTTGSTKLCDGDDEIDDAVFSDGIVSGGIAMAKKYRGSHRGSTPHPKGGHQYDYGCLRKVVRRGFPYDFSVDRKCVWQFCLFEQFSDTHLKLSVKDQVTMRVYCIVLNRSMPLHRSSCVDNYADDEG